MSWRRVVLLLLFVLVVLDNARFGRKLFDLYLHIERHGRTPFYLETNLPPTVARPLQEAADAGIARGDRILSVNGKPADPLFAIEDILSDLHPGDILAVTAQKGSEPPREARITVVQLRRGGDVLINLATFAFVVLVCLPLGFGVAALKPNDLRSWILLWMMISFIPSFRLFDAHSRIPAWNVLDYFFHIFIRETWPACMAILGLTFPDRIRVGGWLRRLLGPVLILMIAFTFYRASLLFFFFIGRLYYSPLALWLEPIRNATRFWDIFISLTLIGFYFGILGFRFGLARTREERRRLVLLNAGSHIAFLPIFILVLRSLFLRKEIFEGVPIWISVPAILFLMLFPLTLAYLVLVHRALDIKVVLRTGLQYALATRAVNAVNIVLIVSVALALPRLNVGRELIVLVVAASAILGTRLAKRAKAWIDHRFFRDAYHAEKVLSELSREIRGVPETNALLETVSRRIAESLHITHVATLLRNAHSFQPAFALGFDVPPDASFSVDAPVAKRLETLRTPQRVYLDDPASWVRRELNGHHEYDVLAALQSQLLLPIEGDGKLAGFISLGAKRSEEPYSRGDLQLLQSVANQAGLALENTRLTATVAQDAARRERLAQEMEIAAHVQERLFPQRRPAVPGIDYAGACRPAQSVGGDSYDFLDLTGAFGFSIGDVSGKGVPASILMAVVQTSIRSNAIHATADLAAMMGNVNRIVEEASSKKYFATLFFGYYDPASRLLRYVNAAHNPPLLLRASGEAEWLRPTGHAIGWSRKSAFQEGSTTLAAGDLLLLYTDGFTEAMNASLEEFGEDRLLHAARLVHTLHPEAVIPAILHTVDQFTTGEPQHDDMTMVVLKVR